MLKEFEGEFRGKRNLSNEDLRLEMYSAEIQVHFYTMTDALYYGIHYEAKATIN